MKHSMRPLLECLYLARAMGLLIRYNRSLVLTSEFHTKPRAHSIVTKLAQTTTASQPHVSLASAVSTSLTKAPHTMTMYGVVSFAIALMWSTSVVFDMNTDTSMNWVYLFWSISILCGAFMFSWKLRFCHDAFGISKELALVGISLVAFTIINASTKASLQDSDTKPVIMHTRSW